MQHALGAFLSSETPFELTALIAGLLIWLVVGLSLFRRFSWTRRTLYLAGGVALAYYELQMTWYWFTAGVVLLALALGLDSRNPAKASPGTGPK